MMNGWVYEGFDETYKLLGVDFDKIYYESDTYLLGKKIIEDGLKKNIFFKKPDGSVWIDLTSDGLDEKLVLRADGTSVYITQDLGTANLRYNDYHFGKLIFVVGNEQEYHFKVLKLILKKIGFDWTDYLHHLSYAMVDLPSGKMKSREGTVVDADELMKQMIDEAEKITKELGKIEDFDSDEAQQLYKTIGLGALKYFILKVDPEKRMLFNPAESIDFNGNTGPFIQYTYARIQSVIRKALKTNEIKNFTSYNVSSYSGMNEKEKELLKMLVNFPFVIDEAAQRLSPALIANYVFDISKSFNQFYHECPIVDAGNADASKFRLQLSLLAGQVIKTSMRLLGIDVPERM
jgi:arginyl-tRNA synthetase